MTKMRTIKLGDWVRIDSDDHQIVALMGNSVRLRSCTGRAQVVLAADLLSYYDAPPVLPAPRAAVEQRADTAPGELQVDGDALVDVLPDAELKRVRALESHLLEVMTGYRTGVGADGEEPHHAYLPSLDLTEKIKAKHAELSTTPLACSERTLWRAYDKYREFGAWGLVNRSRVRISNPLTGLDPRVREVILEQALIETADSSAGFARFYNRVEQRLIAKFGADAPPLPKDRTFRRRVAELLGKQHPTRPADQRRNDANKPQSAYGQFYASRPGQVVMMDSTRFDVLAYDPETDQTLPIELTIAVDLFTRSIVAWRFTPLGANAVDAVMLLADMLTPEPMRPGWADRLRHSYYRIPVEREYGIDERVKEVKARPVIWPETIIVDNGKIFVSDALRAGCNRYGITLHPARFEQPTDKPQVERAFGTIRTQFAEHLAGYKGRNVSHRGRAVEATARWTIDEIAEFFAEYVVMVYQRHPHRGLFAPGDPDVAMSPNDMYALGIAVAGEMPMPGDAEPYLELLPVEWRQMHNYGVQIDRLIYNGNAVREFLTTPCPYPNGLWPIRKDPRNRLHVYVKHPETGWHALKWAAAEDWMEPFSDRSIAYVHELLKARGRAKLDVEEVAAELKVLQLRMDAPETATAKDLRRLTRDRARVRSTLRDQARVGSERLVDDPHQPLQVIDSDRDEAEQPEGSLDLSQLLPFNVYGEQEPTGSPKPNGGAHERAE